MKTNRRGEALLDDLQSILQDHRTAIRILLNSPPVSARRLYLRRHLPLLLLHPVFWTLSPYRWYRDGFLPEFGAPLLSPLIVTIILGIAVLYDRVIEHNRGPRIWDFRFPLYHHTALYLHMPLSAAGVFHLIHPFVGVIMIAAAAIQSLYASFRCNTYLYGFTLRTSIVYYLQALLIPAILLFLIALITNMLKSAMLI